MSEGKSREDTERGPLRNIIQHEAYRFNTNEHHQSDPGCWPQANRTSTSHLPVFLVPESKEMFLFSQVFLWTQVLAVCFVLAEFTICFMVSVKSCEGSSRRDLKIELLAFQKNQKQPEKH